MEVEEEEEVEVRVTDSGVDSEQTSIATIVSSEGRGVTEVEASTSSDDDKEWRQ